MHFGRPSAREIQGYWSEKAKKKGIFSIRDLERYLAL
jgi:hypothetical protein